MSAPRILLIADSQADDGLLIEALSRAGYEVRVLHSIQTALESLEEDPPDLVIFDGASLHSAGVDACRRVRNYIGAAPLIHTRENGIPKDENAGADVYLMQPFTARKVLNRVKALLPADQFAHEIVRAGAITFYREKLSVGVKNLGEKQLTPKQARLLEEFLRHPDQVLDRRQLMQNVWDTDYIGDTRTLDVHIRWLREAIERDPGKPRHIVTVRGVGYIFRISPPDTD